VLLDTSDVEGARTLVEPQLLGKVWKSWAPSKVIAFSWKLLQDRVPT